MAERAWTRTLVALIGGALIGGALACGSPAAEPDGGGAADTGPIGVDAARACSSPAECDDGSFCNGAERCAPGDPSADALGCAPASAPPCPAERCREAERACASDCDVMPDADLDGHAAIECGGDDCDDSDPDRYPGNTEVCDAEGRDEDCDPSTLAGTVDGDRDRDGYVNDQCCNRQPGGALRCGDDCDDARAGVHPGAVEVCNRVDDNCNLLIDEDLPLQSHHPDCDGDMYGAVGSLGAVDCTLPSAAPPCGGLPTARWATNADDCDDTSASVHPAAPEVCNRVDDNCNGMIDEGLPVQSFYPDCDGDMYGARGSAAVVDCAVPSAPPPCGGVATTRWATSADDCNDTSASIHPAAPEVCDGVDNDCDEVIDEDADAVTCYRDMDGDSFGDLSVSMTACFCPPGWVGATVSDCNDGSATVRPNQTSFFAASYTSADGSTSFDYNCNGVEERRWTLAKGGPCDALASSSSRCNGPGWASATAPACGTEGDWISCVFVELEPLERNRCVRATADERRRQECR